MRTLIFFVGFLIGAVALWIVPYNTSELFGIHIYQIVAWSTGLASVLFCVFSNSKPFSIPPFLILGVLLAQVTRIVYDLIFFDSSSHNLVPFELLLMLGVNAIPAYLGAFVGFLYHRLGQNRSS